MAYVRNLRDGGGFALKLWEKSVRGHVMLTTGRRGCAAAGEEMVEGMRPLARRRARFRAVQKAGIGEILTGSAAIRNRCKSLKIKGAGHF
jgi:hypothetical protein